MNKKLTFLFIGVIIACVAAGAFYWQSKDDQTSSTTQPTTSTDEEEVSTETEEEATPETPAENVIITYTNGGFSPESYTVVAGSKVIVRNNSDNDLQFSSDEHPTHKDNSELNLDTISPGETIEFTPQTAGTWGFHDHLNDNNTGTLLVEQP